MNLLTSDTCPWCGHPSERAARLCRKCGHYAHFPQIYCECAACMTTKPVTTTPHFAIWPAVNEVPEFIRVPSRRREREFTP